MKDAWARAKIEELERRLQEARDQYSRVQDILFALADKTGFYVEGVAPSFSIVWKLTAKPEEPKKA